MATMICHICLRTDIIAVSIATELACFIDELSEYNIVKNPRYNYCTICAHLLKKFYNFKQRCLKACRILKSLKGKHKFLPTDLHKLIPSSIGLCNSLAPYQFLEYQHHTDTDLLETNPDLNNEPNIISNDIEVYNKQNVETADPTLQDHIEVQDEPIHDDSNVKTLQAADGENIVTTSDGNLILRSSFEEEIRTIKLDHLVELTNDGKNTDDPKDNEKQSKINSSDKTDAFLSCMYNKYNRRQETNTEDKKLQATSETSKDMRMKQHLSVPLMQFTDLDDETPNNSSPIIIKKEPVSLKEEEPDLVDELFDENADTDSVDTHLTEESIKRELIFREDSNNDNNLIEKSIEIDIKQLYLETDTGKLEPAQAQSLNQKVEVCDTHISEECIKSELMFGEDSNNGNNLIEKSIKIDIKQVNLETDTGKLEPHQAQSLNQKVEVLDSHIISEECIKSELIFGEDSNNGNHLIEKSIEIDIKQLNLETDTGKLESDQAQSLNQKVEIHPEKSKIFCCHICSKLFLVRSKLVSHVLLSHTKKQQCKIFEKGHKRAHTEVKAYNCNICDKQFTRTSHLEKHMRIHTGEKPYACSLCKKRFNVKGNLVTHIKIHTGEKPYSCSFCDKQFIRKSNLDLHIRIHTGEKPYACSLCKKQFNTKCNLVTHMRIHTGEKPYACDICDAQFTQKWNLALHIKRHQWKKPVI